MMRRLRNLIKACAPHGLVESRHRRTHQALNRVQAPVPLLLEERSLEFILSDLVPERVHLPGQELLRSDFMASPVHELAVIACICAVRKPLRIFEFGTYLGSATRVMAMNSTARVTTLDLDGDSRIAVFGSESEATILNYESGSSFIGTKEAERIEQVYGDSRNFDYTPYLGEMDLVFVDADHTYPFVKNDSEWALKLVRHSGIVIWDDYVYTSEHPECSGVAQFLNELQTRVPCNHIRGTRLAIGFSNGREHV